MISLDNCTAVPSPSYHVQKLFMNHHGDVFLAQEISEKGPSVMMSRYPDRPSGRCPGGQSIHGAVENIIIPEEDTEKQHTCRGTVLRPERSREKISSVDSRNYTIRLRAREFSGKKGFTISFGQQDEKNRVFWRLGGWANEDSIIGEDINGRNSCLVQRTRSVEAGRS